MSATTFLYSEYELSTFPETTISATQANGLPVTFIYDNTVGTLPPNLTFSPITGVISGTLAAVSNTTTYNFSVLAHESYTYGAFLLNPKSYNFVRANFAVTVVYCIPPNWISNTLADVVPATTYNVSLLAQDLNSPPLPITYSLASGSLPNGLLLANGVISGLQTGVSQSTTFTFSIEASNGVKSTTADFSIFVPIDHSIVWLTDSSELANVITGHSIETTISAISLDLLTPTYTVTAGSLPGTVMMNVVAITSERIEGIAPVVIANTSNVVEYTSFPFTITATNGFTSNPRAFSIGVGNLLPTWVTNSALGTYYGFATSDAKIEAKITSPSIEALTYQLVSDPTTIPSGMTLASDGTLAGSFPDITSNAAYTFVAEATDGLNFIVRTFALELIPSYPPIWVTPTGELFSQVASNAIDWITPSNLGSYPAEISYNLIMAAETSKYSYALSAIDPQAIPLMYTLQNGSSLPMGVNLSTDGKITGTLTANVGATFTVIVSDGIKQNIETFSIVGDDSVNPLSYTLTSGQPPYANGGYTYAPEITFGSTYLNQVFNYTFTGTNPVAATLTGTFPPVTMDTVWTFEVTANNGLFTNSQTFTVDSLYPYPSWITNTGSIYTGLGDTKLPNSSVDHANAITTIVYSPVGRGITYTINSVHALPNGITHASNVFNGILPSVLFDTSYPFMMNATDGHFTMTRSFSLDAELNPFLTWEPSENFLGNVFKGSYSTTAILATSATGAPTYSVDDQLPPGLSIANATPGDGVPVTIHGVLPDVNSETTYQFTLTANTAAGFSISRQFSLYQLYNDVTTGNSDFTDPYSNSVTMLLHLEGADKGTVFTDSDVNVMHAGVETGAQHEPGANTSTHRALYGQSSVILDGQTYLYAPWRPDFEMSTTDWTVEFSIFFTGFQSKKGSLFGCTTFWIEYDNKNNQLIVNYQSLHSGSVQLKFPAVFSLNTWHQVAIVRSANTTTMRTYIDGGISGVISNSTIGTFSIPSNNSTYDSATNTTIFSYYHFATTIGAHQTLGPAGDFLGTFYLDEFRVSRAARYSGSSYFVSSYPFPDVPAFSVTTGGVYTNDHTTNYTPVEVMKSILGGTPTILPIIATNPYNQGLVFTQISGTFPPTITVNGTTNIMNLLGNGVLEGTPYNPTTDTKFTFGIQVADSNNSAIREYYLTILHNKPPVWQTPPGLLGSQVVTGHPFSNKITATDPENQPLEYKIISGALPPGLILNSVTGAIKGNTVVSNVSVNYFFTATVDDYVNTPITRDFEIATLGNAPPVWQTPSGNLVTIHSGGYVHNTVVAVDSNQQTITYALVSGSFPPSIHMTPYGLIAGFTANIATPTVFNFSLSASNGYGNSVQSFAITVSPSIAPFFTNIGTFFGTGGSIANGVITATDPQNLPLTFSMGSPALPVGLGVDGASGDITGTLPNPIGNATYAFQAMITNQIYSCSATYHYFVKYIYAPVWNTSGSLGNFSGGALISIVINATDPQNLPLTYLGATGVLPPGLVYNKNTQTLQGTLTPATGGDVSYSFYLSVTNGVQTNTQQFTLTSKYSGPPIFLPITNNIITAAIRSTSYSYTFQLQPDLLTSHFVLTGTLPTGLTFNTTTGTISGTPTNLSPSNYSLQVMAINSAGNAIITVTLPYVTLPTWVSSGTIASWYPSNPVSNNIQSVTLSATSTSGYPLLYNIVSGALPTGMTLNSTTGVISGIVPAISLSTATAVSVVYSVQDSSNGIGFGDTVNKTLVISVKAPPLPSGTVNPASLSLVSGQSGTIALTITDAVYGTVGSTFTIDSSSTPLPSGLTISNNGNGTGQISGTVDQSVTSGTYTITVDIGNPFVHTTKTAKFIISQLTTPVWNCPSPYDISSFLNVGIWNTYNVYNHILGAFALGSCNGNIMKYGAGPNSAGDEIIKTITGNLPLITNFVYQQSTVALTAGTMPTGLTITNNLVNDTGSVFTTGSAIGGFLNPSSIGQTFNWTLTATTQHGAVVQVASNQFSAIIPDISWDTPVINLGVVTTNPILTSLQNHLVNPFGWSGNIVIISQRYNLNGTWESIIGAVSIPFNYTVEKQLVMSSTRPGDYSITLGFQFVQVGYSASNSMNTFIVNYTRPDVSFSTPSIDLGQVVYKPPNVASPIINNIGSYLINPALIGGASGAAYVVVSQTRTIGSTVTNGATNSYAIMESNGNWEIIFGSNLLPATYVITIAFAYAVGTQFGGSATSPNTLQVTFTLADISFVYTSVDAGTVTYNTTTTLIANWNNYYLNPSSIAGTLYVVSASSGSAYSFTTASLKTSGGGTHGTHSVTVGFKYSGGGVSPNQMIVTWSN